MNKRTAILTSGGDSPGMSTGVVALTKALKYFGIEVRYVRNGYQGLVENKIEIPNEENSTLFANNGGSFIGSGRLPEFEKKEVRKIAIENLRKQNISSLVVIGGDGSYKGAEKLTEEGIGCVCLPGTIDNDVVSSEYTIGFDTAINVAQEAIRNVQDTMDSHQMCGVIEVMGRHCSDIAVFAGISANADIISVHEHKLTIEEITNKISHMRKNGKRGFTVVVAEYLYDVKALVKEIQERTGVGTRAAVLGHIQRGGRPTAMDSYRTQLMSFEAARCIRDNIYGVCLGINKNKVEVIKINKALNMKTTSYKELIDFYNKTR